MLRIESHSKQTKNSKLLPSVFPSCPVEATYQTLHVLYMYSVHVDYPTDFNWVVQASLMAATADRKQKPGSADGKLTKVGFSSLLVSVRDS